MHADDEDPARLVGKARSAWQNSSEGRWLLTVAVGLSGFLILVIVLLKELDMPDVGDIAGALLTSAGVFVGLVFKRQSDQRLSLESKQAARRLDKEHKYERERVRLDGAMRAASLFNASDDAAVDPASIASGLLALTDLNRVGLAVVLLVDLWPPAPAANSSASRVSTETAVLVIDAALRSDDSAAQLIAAELLCRHAVDLDPCASLHWPSSIDGRWTTTLSPRTKLLLVDALVTMATAGPATENALNSTALRLYSIWDTEAADSHAKRCIALLLSALWPAIERLPYVRFMQGPVTVAKADFRAAAATCRLPAEPEDMLEALAMDRRQKLETWSAQCRALSQHQGALAIAV